MKPNSAFTNDIQFSPYWWDASPPPTLPSAELPQSVDVAVVGCGYTGLHAALVTARAGRSTIILEAHEPGYGCSTRNGGQISTSIKPGLAELTKRYGRSTAENIVHDGRRSLDWIEQFITEEKLDCHFKRCGRFHAAHNVREFNQLVAAMESQPVGFEVPVQIVPKHEQHSELATDAYHGGVVFEQHASLDPGRYHTQLLQRVLQADVNVQAHCKVGKIKNHNGYFLVDTPRGVLKARDVIIATNGYTGSLTPWHRRRVVPIGSYVIATEQLDASLMDRLMPRDRIYSDTRKVVYYYRASPDRQRIVFGGRVSSTETDTEQSGQRLRNDLIALFPELNEIAVSHSWMGTVAYTFDTLAHMGQHDGLYYAMGYCGSGVGMASYSGHHIGHRVIGSGPATGIEAVPFSTRPLYAGKPWFLPAVVAWYRWRDQATMK